MCSDKGWSSGDEHFPVASSWGSLDRRHLGVSQGGLGVLSDLITKHRLVWLDDSLDDVDRLSSGAVSTGHLVVHLGDSSTEGVVSVLLVHVDNTVLVRYLSTIP